MTNAWEGIGSLIGYWSCGTDQTLGITQVDDSCDNINNAEDGFLQILFILQQFNARE